MRRTKREGFYVFVASSYELDGLPAYIPCYCGVSAVRRENGTLVTWAYRGPVGNVLKGFKVYVGLFTRGRLLKRIELSTGAIDGVSPSVAYDRVSRRALIVWRRLGENERPLECDLVDVEAFKVLTRLKLEADPDKPAVVIYRGLFYILYRKHGDIYCSLLRPRDGKVILKLPMTSTRISESYPMAVSSGKGVLVVWFERVTGSLGLALIRERGVVRVGHCLVTGVGPRRYGIAYLPGAGCLLACELMEGGRGG